MRLVILIHGDMLRGMSFAPDRPNPGIGGTQFTRIRLADAFARRYPEHTVEVVSQHPITLVSAPENVLVTSAPFDSFLADLAVDPSDWVLTGPSMLLRRISSSILRAVAHRTIISSHLMHDIDLWEAERITRFGAVGCVGAYHYHATRSRSPKAYLRDLFLPGWAQPRVVMERDDEHSALRIVHVGALLPLKGFDDVARIWGDIRRAVPDVSLDVIGGANVYSIENDHPLLPTTRAFGDRILGYLPEDDVSSGRVRFHGRLGAEKMDLIRSADLAILNVANRHECFPAAALECLDLGTPVVGSASNGLWDSMRHFPELSTRIPEDVPPIVARLRERQNELAELGLRGQQVASRFREENGAIVERWEAVATAILEGGIVPSFSPKSRPKPRSHMGLGWAWRRTRYEARRSRAGEMLAGLVKGTR